MAGRPARKERSWAYEPFNWNVHWKAARNAARAGLGFCDALFVGDSVTHGGSNDAGSPADCVSQSFYGVTKAGLLAGGLALAQEYYATSESAERSPLMLYPDLGGPPWKWYTSHLFANGLPLMMVSDVVGVFPANIACTLNTRYPGVQRADILYGSYFSTSWGAQVSYRIDAGGTVTFNQPADGGAALNAYRVNRQQIALDPATRHTIDFGGQATLDNFQPHGAVLVTRTDYGLRIGRIPQSGKSCSDWSNQNNTPVLKIANQFGGWDGTNWGAAGVNNSFPYAADLGIWAFNVNCINQSDTPLSTPAGCYQTACKFVNALRHGRPNASALFLINWYPLDDNYGSGSFSNVAHRQAAKVYHRAIYQAAEDMGAAVVDMTKRWGPDPVTPGYLLQTNIHPGEIGHHDTGDALLELVAA